MTTYYVSQTDGNDANSDAQAQNSATPWKTVDKINDGGPAGGLQPGDSVLFKRGDVWREWLTVPAYGTEAGGYITFGAYGSGDNPIFKKTNEHSSWSVYSGDIYQGTAATNCGRQIIDGTTRVPSFSGAVDDLPAGYFKPPTTNGGVMYYNHPGGAPGTVEIGCRPLAILISGNYVIFDSIDTFGCSGYVSTGSSIRINGTADHVVIRNNEVSFNNGLGVEGGQSGNVLGDILFQNITVHDCGGTGIYNNGRTGGGVYNCTVYNGGKVVGDSGDRGGIGSYKGGNLIFQGNELYNIGPDDTDVAVDMTLSIVDPYGRMEVIGNYIHDTPHGAIQIAEGLNLGDAGGKIAYNIIKNFGYCSGDASNSGKYSGIRIGGGGGGVVSHIEIYNNVIAEGQAAFATEQGGIYVTFQDNHGMLVKNNIFFDNVCRDVVIAADATTTWDAFDNNCYHRTDFTGNWNWKGTACDTLAAWRTASGFTETNSITDDPLFVNANGDYSEATDYQIPTGSPCKNIGVDVGLIEDYGGNTLSGLPDIGAWEYQPIIIPPTFHDRTIYGGAVCSKFNGSNFRKIYGVAL